MKSNKLCHIIGENYNAIININNVIEIYYDTEHKMVTILIPFLNEKQNSNKVRYSNVKEVKYL